MTRLLGYPRGEVRVLRVEGTAPHRVVPTSSPGAKLKWLTACAPIIGGPLWEEANERLKEAWGRGIAALQAPEALMTGWVGQSGPLQCLTILPRARIPRFEYSVAKVAVGDQATCQINAEARVLSAAAAANYPHAPRGRLTSDSQVLLLEHVQGQHPTWSDGRVHEWLLTREAVKFRFTHGDITPWNLLRTARSYVILDWEFAVLGVQEDLIFDVLDYVLRGALSAKARVTNVRIALGRLVQTDLIDRSSLLAALEDYPEYRARVRPSGDAWSGASAALCKAILREFR